jgi:hypothetical protein
MSLVGLPLQLLAVTGVVVAGAALAVLWPRLRGWWRLGRIGGIIVCQLLLIFAVGLAVNRTEDFYPSWSALLGDNPPTIVTQPPPALSLSKWLHGQQAHGERSGLSFQWRADEDRGWYLRAPTTVFLPRTYFLDPAAAMPVVVVLVGPEHTADALSWAPARMAALAPKAPAAIVLVQPGAAGPSAGFRRQFATQLASDLRVSPGGWGVVGVGTGASAALGLFRDDPGHFGALALPLTDPARAGAYVRAVADEHPLLLAKHDSVAVTLQWVYGQLPPALSPPLLVGSNPATNRS